MTSRAPVWIVTAAALLVLGAAVGLASVATHELTWGLPLAATASVAMLVALPPVWWARASFGLGWGIAGGYLSQTRPEGDYVIATDVRGYLVVALGVVVLVSALVTSLFRSGSVASTDSSDGAA